MHLPVPEDLLEAFGSYRKFVVIGHEEPDGDCLSSQLALASLLERRGAEALPVSPGPFGRNEVSHLANRFLQHIPEDFRGVDTIVFVLDCSTIDRISYLADETGEAVIAVIDHHASGESFGDIRYIDPEAPSVTYMVQKIITALGDSPTSLEAEHLLFGLATDTGFFRHLAEGSSSVFRAAADLVEAGASPRKVHHRMYGGREFDSRTLLGRLLSRTEQYYGGKLLATYETLQEKREFGEHNRDSDTLYQHLQGVKNCEVVILVREEQSGECSVGLRSNNDVDAGAAAKYFGGGGHPKAAGFIRRGGIEETKNEVVRYFAGALL